MDSAENRSEGYATMKMRDKPPASAPLSRSLRSGAALSKVSLLTPAMTPWHALRQMKELIRSQQRSWYSFSTYERMKLLRPPQPPPGSVCEFCTRCHCCRNEGHCGKSVCHSSVSTHSCSGDFSRHGFMSETSSCVSSIHSQFGSPIGLSAAVVSPGVSPFIRNVMRDVGGGNREGSVSIGQARAVAQQTRQLSVSAYNPSCSNFSCESSTSSQFRAGDDGSASVAEACGGTFGVPPQAAAIIIHGQEEARRIIPPAASPLLRFPRVFPGYHFPPQPSAVPSAFFERPGQNKQFESDLDELSKDECGPKTALQLLQCMLADTAAATIQRCIRGYFTRLRYQAALVWRRLLQQQQQREHHAATSVQSAWRALKSREELMKLKRCRELRIERNAAAVKIQAFWKMRKQIMLFEIEKLTRLLHVVRSMAAVEIQRVWRGHRTRCVMDEEWHSWVVKWIWDKPSAIVEFVGDFSSPPWTKRHLMKFCHIRKCHVIALPRTVGRHEVKFIVNGRYVCDGSQTVITDGSGHFNNLVRVRPATLSLLQISRRRLMECRARAFSRSASSPAVQHNRKAFVADCEDPFAMTAVEKSCISYVDSSAAFRHAPKTVVNVVSTAAEAKDRKIYIRSAKAEDVALDTDGGECILEEEGYCGVSANEKSGNVVQEAFCGVSGFEGKQNESLDGHGSRVGAGFALSTKTGEQVDSSRVGDLDGDDVGLVRTGSTVPVRHFGPGRSTSQFGFLHCRRTEANIVESVSTFADGVRGARALSAGPVQDAIICGNGGVQCASDPPCLADYAALSGASNIQTYVHYAASFEREYEIGYVDYERGISGYHDWEKSPGEESKFD